jgi:hypothetical protein
MRRHDALTTAAKPKSHSTSASTEGRQSAGFGLERHSLAPLLMALSPFICERSQVIMMSSTACPSVIGHRPSSCLIRSHVTTWSKRPQLPSDITCQCLFYNLNLVNEYRTCCHIGHFTGFPSPHRVPIIHTAIASYALYQIGNNSLLTTRNLRPDGQGFGTDDVERRRRSRSVQSRNWSRGWMLGERQSSGASSLGESPSKFACFVKERHRQVRRSHSGVSGDDG